MDTATVERINQDDAREVERLAPGVANVVNSIVAEGPNMALPGRMNADQVKDWINELGERGGMFYALVRDKVVAFAALRAMDEEAGTARVGVWVLPEHRRRGLGMELSRAAIEYARARGYSKLQGTIPGDNESALSFFSAVGPIAAIEGGGMRYELPV
jgi:L-amino acid N-acyltransferase YncA